MVNDKENSNYYNKGLEKERLSLMKESYKVSYKSEANKKQKEIANRLIQEQKERIGKQEGIKKQEKKIYEKGLIGRFEKAQGKLAKNIESVAKAKFTNRSILKAQPRATIHIQEKEVGNIFHEENRFFKGNFEQEKRSMFLQ